MRGTEDKQGGQHRSQTGATPPLDVIQLIRHDPLGLIGQRCVFRLREFTRGYVSARWDLELSEPAHPDSSGHFNLWVREKLGLESKTHAWPSMIWVVSPNEVAA